MVVKNMALVVRPALFGKLESILTFLILRLLVREIEIKTPSSPD